MVFQSLALFPHMSVSENIAYPLTIRGRSKAQCRARADELLSLVQLEDWVTGEFTNCQVGSANAWQSRVV